MSHKKTVGLLALCGLLSFSAVASRAEAGLLDRWLSKKKPQVVSRSQSPEFEDYEVDTSGFCNDCDHNPRPVLTELCRRNLCHGTYYPGIPPYCAPCWGSYPTCFRRTQECWICPQERYAIKRRPPKPRTEWQHDVPPAPPALGPDSGLSPPPMDTDSEAPAGTPAPPPVDEDDLPARRESTSAQLPQAPLVEADTRRADAARPVARAERPRQTARVEQTNAAEPAASNRRTKARSIEELLQDLQ